MELINVQIEGISTKDAARIAKRAGKGIGKAVGDGISLQASPEGTRAFGVDGATIVMAAISMVSVTANIVTILTPIVEEVRRRSKATGLKVIVELVDGGEVAVSVPEGADLQIPTGGLPEGAEVAAVRVTGE